VSLPFPVRNAIKRSIEDFTEQLIKQGRKPAMQSGKKWKYKNASDWHYGHFVGMMEESSRSTYEKIAGVPITIEQMKEIEEIIEEYGRGLRDYFQSFDSV